MRLSAATVLFALCVPGQAQESPTWDLAKCQRLLTEDTAKAGHVCTTEHLEADLAKLAKDLKGPLPADSSALAFERVFAESGLVEMGEGVQRSQAELEKAQEAAKQAEAEVNKAGADVAAMRAPTVRWTAGSPYSSEFLSRGHKVRLIATESLAILALIQSSETDPLRIEMQVFNRGHQPFDLIPDSFSLAVVEPKTKAKPLPYLSPKQVAKKIKREAAWLMAAEAVSSMGRALAGSTTQTSGTVTTRDGYGGSTYGTYNGLTTTYDNAANQQQTAANMAKITDAAEAKKIRQTTGALLPNTVFPGQSYGGVVHFKREKRAELMILRVPFGGQIFEFPLEMPRK